MSHGIYEHDREMLQIQLITVNRKDNYVYTAIQSPIGGWCTNAQYDLKDFEEKLKLTLEDGDHRWTTFLVSDDFCKNLKGG